MRAPASSRHRALGLIALLAGALLALLATAPQALAHAQLLGTSPVSGTTVAVEPTEVIFKFNQNVGGTLGAVRVYDAQGNEVDDLDVSHPQGNEHWMGVGLKPHLRDGTYTGTYRVISADTHIVYGGLVFDIGHAGAPPKFTVAGLIGKNQSGEVTRVAFGVVRALDYLTIALMIGGLAFLYVAWTPALSALARPDGGWPEGAEVFARRMRWLLAVAVVTGLIVSVLGILLQGATAAGVSLWSSLKGSVLENTLESRFGEVWAGRAFDWLVLGAVLVLAEARRSNVIPGVRAGASRPASAEETLVLLGAPGSDGPPHVRTGGPREESPSVRVERPRPTLLALLVLGCVYLAITPALAGHASIQSPTGVFLPSDAIHVLAGSVWVGGIACLLIALPGATRRLEGPDRTRLLFGCLARFSPLALAAVIAIAATGVIQAYIDVRSVHALFSTTYGLLIVAKTALLLSLIGLGWTNRARVIPALRRIAGAGASPGGTGVLARRTMRSELAVMIGVFGVTAALIAYAPPIDAASGPFSTNTTLGPAELEMTVEPARIGLNTAHLYLIDAKTGAQYTATKELTAVARLPSKHIGPLPLKATLAGPGHYILSSAVLSPGGTWEIEIIDRVSEFEQNTRVVKVPIA